MKAQKAKLVLKDDTVLEASLAAVAMMNVVATFFEAGAPDDPVFVPNATPETMARVISYCEYHSQTDDEDTSAWDAKFFEVSHEVLYDLILVSNQLDIPTLLEACCQCVANMAKGMSPEELVAVFQEGAGN